MLLRHTRAHVLGDASTDSEMMTSSYLAEKRRNSTLSSGNRRCHRTQLSGRNNPVSSPAGSNSGQDESTVDMTDHVTLQDVPSSLHIQQMPIEVSAASAGGVESCWASDRGLEDARGIGVESIPNAPSLPPDAFQTWLSDFDAHPMTMGSVPNFPDLTSETCCFEPAPDVSGRDFNKTRLLWPIRPRRIAPMIHTLWQDISSCSNKNLLSQKDQVGAGVPPSVYPKDADSILEKLRRLTARFLGCGCRVDGSTYAVDAGTSTGDNNMPRLSQPNRICHTCESAAELFRLGLEQYKRRFHAIIPIVHIPTFCPDDIPSTLLLVMCMLGLTFVNSDEATALVSRAFPVSQLAS